MILARKDSGYELLGDTNLVGLDEEEEKRAALKLLVQQKVAEDARNIKVRQAQELPPPRDTKPKMNPKQMAGLQNLLLQVREGKIAAPTQGQSLELQGMLLGTPEENAAREADYAETERIKQLVAKAEANKDTGASFNINPVTGNAAFMARVPEGFERTYSEKQKQKISQLNNAIQEVENDPKFDRQDKDVAIRKATMQLNSIRPSMRVKEPPPPMGDSWESTFLHPDTGALMGYDRNKMPRVLVQPQNMPDYIEKTRQDKREIALLDAHAKRMDKEADLQASREERISNKRMELAADDSAVQDGVDAKGKPKYRARTRTEIDAIIRDSGLADISGGDVSITRVATPEQLQWGPLGMPPAAGPQPPPYSEAAPPVFRVSGDADRSKVPKGAIYIGPDGKRRRKS